jgi:tetratricopeptide (TPR) repeat protein
MRIAIVVVALLLAQSTVPAGAQVFPQLDRPDGSRKGIPKRESFGTLVEELGPGQSSDDPDTGSYDAWASSSQLMDAYLLALEGRAYPEAIDIARRMVAEAAAEFGTEDRRYGLVLSDLGAALYHNGEPDLALEPLRRSLNIVSQRAGLFHPDLIGIHAYLGMALQAVGDHGEALDYLTRAQSLTHRHQGAMNPSQMKLLYAKAHSLEAEGEYWQAEQMFRAALRVSRHNFGDDSLEALTPLYRLAIWLRDNEQFRPALSLYREALELHRGEDGADTPAMVPAMRGMALTYLLEQSFEVDRGLTLNRRIAELARTHPEQFSLHERIRALLDYGDWLLMFHREEEAWAQYADAWMLAQRDESDSVDWELYFTEPRLIYAGPPVSLDVMGYQVVGKEQWNDFEFRIAKDGRPTHVRVVDSNMHALTRRHSMQLLREGRFRPALPGGRPAEVESHQLRRVYPTDPPPDFGIVDVGGSTLPPPSR